MINKKKRRYKKKNVIVIKKNNEWINEKSEHVNVVLIIYKRNIDDIIKCIDIDEKKDFVDIEKNEKLANYDEWKIDN